MSIKLEEPINSNSLLLIHWRYRNFFTMTRKNWKNLGEEHFGHSKPFKNTKNQALLRTGFPQSIAKEWQVYERKYENFNLADSIKSEKTYEFKRWIDQ